MVLWSSDLVNPLGLVFRMNPALTQFSFLCIYISYNHNKSEPIKSMVNAVKAVLSMSYFTIQKGSL